jgi:hypothetical protein
MSELFPQPDARARKNEAQILRQLASVGLSRIAVQFGVDETTVGRWKEKEIPRAAQLLALLSLKCVPQSRRCYNEEVLGAVVTLAQVQMSRIKGIEHLLFEDDAE